MKSIPRNYWPYDEVRISRDAQSQNRFHIQSPWIKFHVDLAASDSDRANQIASKLSNGEVTPSDLNEINWFFSSLAKFPLSYILPRAGQFGTDEHALSAKSLDQRDPHTLVKDISAGSPEGTSIDQFCKSSLPKQWSWDIDAALDFSKVNNGYDPETLFSVARRFHLLNDLEWNKTADLNAHISSLKNNPNEFRKASALVVRQNHYVTAKCDEVLRSALPLAQSAFEEVSEFIAAESGHDKILAKALRSLGVEPSEVKAINCVVTLMELFKLVAKKNLLGFAMVTDIFERSSYRDEDPLTALLNEGGEYQAGKQVDVHREINDQGEHENVALGFLHFMKPVDQQYAIEALRLAELATLTIHQLSADTLKEIRSTSTSSD